MCGIVKERRTESAAPDHLLLTFFLSEQADDLTPACAGVDVLTAARDDLGPLAANGQVAGTVVDAMRSLPHDQLRVAADSLRHPWSPWREVGISPWSPKKAVSVKTSR